MGYLVSIILVISGLFIHRSHKNWAYPSSIFCYLWGTVSFLASLRLYGLNEVSIKTWLIILFGAFSFITGCQLSFKTRRNSIDKLQISDEESRVNALHTGLFSRKIYFILFIIVAINLLIDLNQTIRLLNSGYSLDRIRAASFGMYEIQGYRIATDSLSLQRTRIIEALQAILIAVGIEYFIKDPKRNWMFLVASLFLVVGDALSDGGRWGIIYFIVEIFACFRILNYNGNVKSYQISKKTKRRIVYIFAFLLIITAFVTNSRWTGDLRKHYYAYFCGCIPLLDLKISEIEASGLYSVLLGSQYGVWSFFIPILQKLLGVQLPFYQDTIAQVMTGQQFYDIGLGSNFNAFVTCFYYPYADLRIFGVFFGMLFFGVACGMLYRNNNRKSNFGVVTPYIIMTQVIIKSVQTYPLTSNVYVYVFLIVLITYRIRSKNGFAE